MDFPKASILLLLVCASQASITCGPGGVICPSGACQYPTYIEGCATYASASVCAECEYNYVLSQGSCVYTPSSDYSSCCKAFKPTGECYQCAKGLVLIDGQCKDRKIVGCLEKTASGSCNNCAAEYQLIGGVCLKKVTGCASYSSTGACQACDQGFVQSGSFCVKDLVSNITIPGCSVQFDFGCADCAQGYRLLPDGTCKQGVIEGCERYANNGACSVCKPPVYSISNGLCITYGCLKLNDNGKCIQCDSSKNFVLGSDGLCQIQNCLVSNLDSCLICENGYTETGRGCTKSTAIKQCTICPTNTFLSETGECVIRQVGCVNYKGSKCVQCEDKYYLSPNAECVEKVPGCVYNNGICSTCYLPFQLVAGACVIEGCVDYYGQGCKTCRSPYVLSPQGNYCTYPNCNQVSGGKCVSCCDGFAVNHEGFCYQLDPLCKAYDFSGKCTQCTLGYYLDDSTQTPVCKQELFGCNYVDRKCVSCRAPFEYNSTSQTCQIDGCTKYFLGGCEQCASGYDLRYNSCKLPNCLISFKNTCKQCDPDYILRSDGLCVNKDEFCWKYDDKGFCSECAQNYYMSKINQKCQIREPGCLYDANDRCYACEQPFYFDGIRCEIYGCLELFPKGCKQCYYPLQVTDKNLCTVPNCDKMVEDKCVACCSGYQVATDGSCVIMDPKCLVSAPQGCSKCAKGYRVDQSGRCQYADEHCWDFSEQGHCTNCDRLYFLNQFNKCEMKDNTCAAYSNGRCIDCKSSYYLHAGLCFPNAKGCLSQRDIKTCVKCESGYSLSSGVCTPALTKLTWDSIDMDFWSGSSDKEVEVSKEVFTVGKTNKYNLDGAIIKGNAQVIYSSVVTGRVSFQVDDQSDVNGWSPAGSSSQWIGVLLDRLETFYALDIKYVQGNTMTKFAIEESDDGVNFRRVTEITTTKMIIGSVETFYFTPVHSKAIRIVVLSGNANIKIEFYYSNGENKYFNESSTTWIQQQTESTIIDVIKGSQFVSGDKCNDKSLCWMGVELCEIGDIKGFQLNAKTNTGLISAVTVKYSRDGVNFSCFNNCQELQLSGNGSFKFSPPVSAIKLRIYPSKWTGQPECTVMFDY